MKSIGRPLWGSTPPCGRRRNELAERSCLADEAHFRADVELRGKWTLKDEPALVDSSSPRYGERASYYSAVCLEHGGGGVDGAGGEQQRRKLRGFPGTVA